MMGFSIFHLFFTQKYLDLQANITIIVDFIIWISFVITSSPFGSLLLSLIYQLRL